MNGMNVVMMSFIRDSFKTLIMFNHVSDQVKST